MCEVKGEVEGRDTGEAGRDYSMYPWEWVYILCKMYGKPSYNFKQKGNHVQLISGKDKWLLGRTGQREAKVYDGDQ